MTNETQKATATIAKPDFSPERPFCLSCRRSMVPMKTGYRVQVGGMMVAGDEFACESCLHRIVTSFGEPWEVPA